jgi:hypothetical protein
MGGVMFIKQRGNPVTREEYENLLQRVIALEEQNGQRTVKSDSGKRDRQRNRLSGFGNDSSQNEGA